MKSPQKQHFHHFIFICLLMVVGLGQECDEGYVWIDEIPEDCESDGNCFYQGDLDVLQIFIDNSQNDNNNSIPPPINFHPLDLGGSPYGPGQIWENGRLVELMLHSTQSEYYSLSGVIPPSIGNLTYLKSLYLDNNNFSGIIPSEIGNLIFLEEFRLLDNQLLSGPIPPEIGNLTNLSVLDLSWNNNLSGEIPSQIGQLLNLSNLGLRYNNLTGELPSEIWMLTNLWTMTLQGNNLTGEIPSSVDNLNLFYLFLSYNNFGGHIPESICNLNLYSNTYYLTNNNFCPPYPNCLSEEDIGYQNTSECIEYQLGDVNQDTEINIVDIVIIVDYLLGNQEPTEQQFILSDWNQDGNLNVTDIVNLIQYILNN